MKKTLHNLLAQGKTKQVIDILKKLTAQDAELYAEIIQLSARFAQYERQLHMKLEDSSLLCIEWNKINNALIDIIGRMNESSTNVDINAADASLTSISKPFLTKKRWVVLGIGLIVFMVVLSNGVIILDYLGIKTKDKGKFINVTVHVEDKMNATTLRKQGYVRMLASGGEMKKELIDDKDAASFKNVKVGDKVRLNVDFSEPYCPLKPDSDYIIPADGRINLIVGLQNLNRVFGTVIWRDQPLVGVIVAIGDLRDTTDATGRYNILIPESAQRKEQEVKFLKTGYKMLIKMAFPQTNEPLNIVMEK